MAAVVVQVWRWGGERLLEMLRVLKSFEVGVGGGRWVRRRSRRAGGWTG